MLLLLLLLLLSDACVNDFVDASDVVKIFYLSVRDCCIFCLRSCNNGVAYVHC